MPSSHAPEAYRRRASEMLAHLERIFAGEEGRVPIGPRPLDETLHGLGAEFVVIYGRGGTGKSDLLANVAVKAAETRRVVLCSMELASNACMRRLLPCLSCQTPGGVPLTAEDFALRDRLDTTKAEGFERVYARAMGLFKAMTIVDDRSLGDVGGHSIEAIGRAAHAIALDEGAPPVVLVDYAQLVGVETPAFSVTDIVDRVSRGLATIAHREGTPVVAVSSVGKDGTIRSSSQITHDADIIIQLTTASDNEDGTRDLDAVIEKFREGQAPQTVELRYWPAYHFMGGRG